MRKNVLGNIAFRLLNTIYYRISEFICDRYEDGTWIPEEPKWLNTLYEYAWKESHWLSVGQRILPVQPLFIAGDLIEVQPLSGPVGLVFYLNYYYGEDGAVERCPPREEEEPSECMDYLYWPELRE